MKPIIMICFEFRFNNPAPASIFRGGGGVGGVGREGRGSSSVPYSRSILNLKTFKYSLGLLALTFIVFLYEK